MKLGRFLFEPWPVDKVFNIWGAIPRQIKMSKRGYREHIPSPRYGVGRGWRVTPLGSIQQHLEEDIVAEDSRARRPRCQALDVHSTRIWRAKLHHLLADADLSTEANDGQASGLFSTLKNPHRIPANTAPVFRCLWWRIYLSLLRLVTNGNVRQAPGQLDNPPGTRSWQVSLTRVGVGLKMVLCVHS